MNRVEFFNKSWKCGDGCCSEHWVEADVWQNGEPLVTVKLPMSWVWEENEESQREAKDEILDRFPDLKEEEVEWVF